MLKSPLFRLVVRLGMFSSTGAIGLDPPMVLVWRMERFHIVGDQPESSFEHCGLRGSCGTVDSQTSDRRCQFVTR